MTKEMKDLIINSINNIVMKKSQLTCSMRSIDYNDIFDEEEKRYITECISYLVSGQEYEAMYKGHGHHIHFDNLMKISVPQSDDMYVDPEAVNENKIYVNFYYMNTSKASRVDYLCINSIKFDSQVMGYDMESDIVKTKFETIEFIEDSHLHTLMRLINSRDSVKVMKSYDSKNEILMSDIATVVDYHYSDGRYDRITYTDADNISKLSELNDNVLQSLLDRYVLIPNTIDTLNSGIIMQMNNIDDDDKFEANLTILLLEELNVISLHRTNIYKKINLVELVRSNWKMFASGFVQIHYPQAYDGIGLLGNGYNISIAPQSIYSVSRFISVMKPYFDTVDKPHGAFDKYYMDFMPASDIVHDARVIMHNDFINFEDKYYLEAFCRNDKYMIDVLNKFPALINLLGCSKSDILNNPREVDFLLRTLGIVFTFKDEDGNNIRYKYRDEIKNPKVKEYLMNRKNEYIMTDYSGIE